MQAQAGKFQSRKVTIEIRPWDSDTDLNELQEKLVSQTAEWRWIWSDTRTEPIAYGLRKIVASVTIPVLPSKRNENVGVDVKEWLYSEFEDDIQTVEIIREELSETSKLQDAVEPCFTEKGQVQLSSAADTDSGAMLSYATYGIRGVRKSMEDAVSVAIDEAKSSCHFAVFDGHGGSQCAEFMAKHWSDAVRIHDQTKDEVIENMFMELDASFDLDQRKTISTYTIANTVGSTANTVTISHIEGKWEITCSNTGDCRSILFNDSRLEALSNDHKPENDTERTRIQDAGGKVSYGRVMGELAVSRAFGDYFFKAVEGKDQRSQMVTALPEILRTAAPCHVTSEPTIILMACDGLWDEFSNSEAASFVRERLATNIPLETIAQELCECACIEKKSQDNISVILVSLS